MIYSANYKIGVSQINKNTEAKDKGILALFEETSAAHVASIGLGLDTEEGRRFAWMILDWKLEIIKRPKYRDTVTVRTWSRKIQRIYAYRDYEMLSENGELLARATSKWVLFDLSEGKLIPPADMYESRLESEPEHSVFDSDIERIKLPSELLGEKVFAVRRADIDTGEHMHNTAYLSAALEILPDELYKEGTFSKIRINYQKQYKSGEDIKASYSASDGVITVVMKDGEDNLHAILTFEG